MQDITSVHPSHLNTGRNTLKGLFQLLTTILLSVVGHSYVLATANQDPVPSTVDVLEPQLSKELIELGEHDQKHRTQMHEKMLESNKRAKEKAQETSGSLQPEVDQEFLELVKKQEEIDKKNIRRLEEIVAKHGWPGKKLVGEQAADAAFLIVQHAELPYQEKYLPLLLKAADSNDVKPAHVAMLQDRVLMRQGKNQIYGSQLRSDPKTGKLELYPIEDEAHVDERRAKVGLPPLKEYLKLFGLE